MTTLRFEPTRILFFTGKGGVGKTSLACATAVALADAGRRVLLVSTDPASNLDEVLGVTLSSRPTPVPGVPGLSALNIDPDAAAHAYRERVVGPYRTLLPASAVARIEEQLSGACTVEIAAFDQFTSLLADPSTTAEYDHVIFDTAPTGHTLRLLKLPAAWTGFIDTNTTGTSCLGPLAGLQSQRELYRASLSALGDAGITTVVLVSRTGSVGPCGSRTDRCGTGRARRQTSASLHQWRVHRNRSNDPIARALETRGREAMAALPEALCSMPRTDVALLPWAPMGADGVRGIFDGARRQGNASPPVPQDHRRAPQSIAGLVDAIERDGTA